MNLNGSIDLLKLSRAAVTTINSLQCVVIPITENDIYVTKDQQTGKAKSAYLSFSAWENKGGANQYGNTHYIKQSFSKDFRERLGDKIKEKPFLGNAKPINFSGQPQQQQPIQQQPSYSQTDDSLPF